MWYLRKYLNDFYRMSQEVTSAKNGRVWNPEISFLKAMKKLSETFRMDLFRIPEFCIKKYHASGNKKRTRMAIVITDKTDFKIKIVTGEKWGHFIRYVGQSIRIHNNYKYIGT